MPSEKNEVTRQFDLTVIPEESRLDGLFSVYQNEAQKEDILRKYFNQVRDEKGFSKVKTIDMAPRSNLVPPPGMSQETLDAMSVNDDASNYTPPPQTRKKFTYNI